MSPETSVPYRAQLKSFVHTSFHVTNNEIMHSYDYVYMGVVKKEREKNSDYAKEIEQKFKQAQAVPFDQMQCSNAVLKRDEEEHKAFHQLLWDDT